VIAPTADMIVASQIAKLVMLTKISAQRWNDFLACTATQQALIVKTWEDISWVKDPSIWPEVVAAIGIILTVANVVSGLAGAASAVVVLKNAL
jgi:hypothetical protein